MFDINTELLVMLLMFSFEDLILGLIVFFCTRWAVNEHRWKYHLPEEMRVNLESRDKMISDRDIRLAEQDEEILQLKKQLKGATGISSGEVEA